MHLLAEIFLKSLVFICVFMCTDTRTQAAALVEVIGRPTGVDSLFLPCGAWEMNAGFELGHTHPCLLSYPDGLGGGQVLLCSPG